MESFPNEQTIEETIENINEDRRRANPAGNKTLTNILDYHNNKICHCSGLETANDEIQKRISDAFEVFDHEHNNTVDLREIGTIIRSLGIFMPLIKLQWHLSFELYVKGFCPSEVELQEIVREMEDPQANGYVHIDRFTPVMAKILQEQR